MSDIETLRAVVKDWGEDTSIDKSRIKWAKDLLAEYDDLKRHFDTLVYSEWSISGDEMLIRLRGKG